MQSSSQSSRLTFGALVLKVASVLKVRPITASHPGLGSGTGGEGQDQTRLCGRMFPRSPMGMGTGRLPDHWKHSSSLSTSPGAQRADDTCRDVTGGRWGTGHGCLPGLPLTQRGSQWGLLVQQTQTADSICCPVVPTLARKFCFQDNGAQSCCGWWTSGEWRESQLGG